MGTRNLSTNWGRYAVLLTLFTGILLHSARLIVGVSAFQGIFTPMLDAIFTIPIVVGIIGMIVTWKHIQFRNRWEKGVVIFTLGYFVVSMPLHLRTWFTGNTDYIAGFPYWYSFIFLGYTAILVWVWLRVKVQ
jgi:hypothetical protein